MGEMALLDSKTPSHDPLHRLPPYRQLCRSPRTASLTGLTALGVMNALKLSEEKGVISMVIITCFFRTRADYLFLPVVSMDYLFLPDKGGFTRR